MQVAITGAQGFIGTNLVPVLEARGHRIRAVSRALLSNSQAFSGCDAVVHLANIAHASADEALLQKVNLEGTRRVAEAAALAGAGRLIYLSSIKASGDETRGRPFDGMEPPLPQDGYGRAKCAAERALIEVSGRTGLQIVILRPPLVYGPHVKANFLALMRAIARGWPLPFSGIRNRRSVVHVENLADLIACSLETAKLALHACVVSDGPPVSTPELCRAIGNALGRPARLFRAPTALIELLPGGKSLTRSLEIDDSAMRHELGWQPKISFEEGLRRTADWYRLECAP
jgi:nucleoside-diphosphate-sugar epimerase